MSQCAIITLASGCGAAGSALDWGSRGRRFKSCHSDHEKKTALAVFFCYNDYKRFDIY